MSGRVEEGLPAVGCNSALSCSAMAPAWRLSCRVGRTQGAGVGLYTRAYVVLIASSVISPSLARRGSCDWKLFANAEIVISRAQA